MSNDDGIHFLGKCEDCEVIEEFYYACVGEPELTCNKCGGKLKEIKEEDNG